MTTGWSAATRLAAVALLMSSAQASHRQSLSVPSGGETRDYLLVTPDSPVPGNRPLVLLLHGHLGTAANALGSGLAPSPLTAWLDIVDREGVLVAALQGLRGSDGHTGWHDCRDDNNTNPLADDVGFATAVVRALVAAEHADPRRVYVMGMSNGAMMSYRLALEMQPTPAAIAAVSGTMAAHSDCPEAGSPVSVLLIHGTDDPLVPYRGGEVRLGTRRSGVVIGVAATRDFWLKVDNVSSVNPQSFRFEHHGADETRASKVTYGIAPGPQVEILTVEHGGHVEPSLRYHYGVVYSRIVGAQNRDLESAEEAWSFFRNKSSQ